MQHVPRTAPSSRRSPQRSPVSCVRGPVHVHEVPLPVMLPSSMSASAQEDGSTSFYDATDAGSSRQGPFTYSASYYGERDGQLGVLSKRRVMPTRYTHTTTLSHIGKHTQAIAWQHCRKAQHLIVVLCCL